MKYAAQGALMGRGRLVALAVAGMVLAGCSSMTRERPAPDDPLFAPIVPSSMESAEPANGSIFQSSRNYNMFGDSVALNVGDILTVTLEEQTTSSKSSATQISKDTEINVNSPSILGRGPLNLATNPNVERDFQGSAGANQSNRLAGNITVTVVEVFPNGVLRVRGEKWLSLTQGEEYVRLTGLVRMQDISPDNTVSSNRIADARISYAGTGDFDQSNRMGWLARFFNSEWWPL